MTDPPGARERTLAQVIEHVAASGIADKSLREIAAGAGTSHRMLLYHFGSREGLLAAIVVDMERRQHEFMTRIAAEARTPRELMTAVWNEVSGDELRPFVRLFFEVVGTAASTGSGPLPDLTDAWLSAAVAAAESVGLEPDPAALRAGVALTRGLLLDLVAGADPAEVDAAHAAYVDAFDRAQGR